MSVKNNQVPAAENFRLNLDELTPDELYSKLKSLQNDAIREAGEAIVGGRNESPSSVHVQVGGSFTRGADCM